jgi:quercetin dioxygenase-like cupin family protein
MLRLDARREKRFPSSSGKLPGILHDDFRIRGERLGRLSDLSGTSGLKATDAKISGGRLMPHYMFDDSNLTWSQFDWLDDVWFYIYGVDRKNGIVDGMFKFSANAKVKIHQHKVPYITLVLQGELRFYRPNGEMKEIRPTGSYVRGIAHGEPHLEGGGDQDTVVFFSFRNVVDELFVFLDANLQPAEIVRIGDVEAALEAQGRAKWLPAA